jgi:hypothetical protein
MGQVPNSGQTTQVGVGDAAILSPPPAPVASPDDLENIEKRLLSEWPGSSSDSEKPSLIEDQTANDLGMVEIPLESMRGDEAEPNVEADSSDAIKTETPEPTEAQPTDDATKAVDETQAEPATITLEESERRQAQAVNTARENLIRQQAAERQRLEVQAKVDAEANAEANRIANMSDSELAQHYRNKQAVDELKANMRPEVFSEVVQTLNSEVGPKVMDALGISNNSAEWPEELTEAWNAAPPETLDARVKLFHEFSVTAAVSLKEAELMLKHQAEIKKLKSDYEGADAESSDAENRNGEAEPSLVGDIGRSGSRSITQIEEAMITGGMASLTPNERQTINAFYQRQGIAPR